MKSALFGLVLATLILGSGGFAAERSQGSSNVRDDSSNPHATPTLRYALLAVIESHAGETGIAFERHGLCPDGCSSLSTFTATIEDRQTVLVAIMRSGVVPAVQHARAFAPPLTLFHPPR